jgi:GntR family transcriptional regulator / MocR family aminotransferase
MDLAIHLDRTSTISLHQQLTEKIRLAILAGRLKPNQKLPSSRSLAKSLNVSRSTVTQSYEQLESEGYLETRLGSGTYICHQIPDDWLKSQQIEPINCQNKNNSTLSQFGNSLISVKRLEVSEPDDEISFRYGNPAVKYFPISQWRKLIARHCINTPALLNYTTDNAGYFPLRVAIADYLGRSRAVQCTPEQIIIVNGSQQALNLISRLTLNPGDWVAIEEPGYLGARHCFTAQSVNLQPIPVNSEGLDVELLAKCNYPFKLIYVTPSHQFPTGVTLTLRQRIALLQWAQTTGTLIIEDDYDSEYRYEQQPIPALQGMDKSQSVIYVGTFSKTMFPSLRIGYLVVPPSWISPVTTAKWLSDRSTPLLEQYALTDWITEGHFERHIRRMRKLYNLRRQILIEAFEKYFGDRVTILGKSAGVHVMVKIKTTLADDITVQKAAAVGIGLISAREYYLQPQHQGEFIFGYAQLEKAQIEQGIWKLSQVLT